MLVAGYLGAIVAANLSSTVFGPSASIVNAFLLIGLDLSARDRLHEMWQGHLARNMAALIATGSGISYLINRDAGPIAVASLVAFAAAAIVDTLTYQRLWRWPYLYRANGSNVLSAAVDSLVFPTLAFGGFLPAVTAAQWAAKVGGGFLWSVVLRDLSQRRGAARTSRAA